MAHPITPMEILDLQKDTIPDFVFEAFNELIAKNLSSEGHAVVMQSEVKDLIVKKSNEPGYQYFARRRVLHRIYDLGWLNVENLYIEAGWIVNYYKPTFPGDIPCRFTFTLKK